MIEKWKEYLDKQGFGGAILMDFLLQALFLFVHCVNVKCNQINTTTFLLEKCLLVWNICTMLLLLIFLRSYSLNFHLIHFNYCVIFWAYLLKYFCNISYSSEYPAFLSSPTSLYLSQYLLTYSKISCPWYSVCLYISDRYRHYEIGCLIRLGTSD